MFLIRYIGMVRFHTVAPEFPYLFDGEPQADMRRDPGGRESGQMECVASVGIVRVCFMDSLIITDMPDDVCSLIYETCGHGATLIDGEGSFAHKNKKIVYSIVSASDTRKLIPKIKELDPNAFINSVRTEEISGTFYMRPRD